MALPIEDGGSIPERIATGRLILRRWRPDDAERLKALIDVNLDHLRPWMPWAMREPSPIEAITERLERFERHHRDGLEWTVAVCLADETVIGSAGLHPRIGPDGLEIGYWIAAPHTGRGYATETAAALTAAAFGLPQIERVEIHCDPRNTASARVPEKLGYRLRETVAGDAMTPTGEPRDTMVWTITRSEHAGQNVPGGRQLLRHALATLAYRASKAVRDAPEEFAHYRVAPQSRTPGEIVAHLGDLMEWAGWQARGEHRWTPVAPSTWDADVARFFTGLGRLDDYLASGARLGTPAERIFSGAVADSLTHVGQLTMLRRLAGAPVRAENYARAEIVPGRVGLEQAPPRVEFD